jgi:hypothetical protein
MGEMGPFLKRLIESCFLSGDRVYEDMWKKMENAQERGSSISISLIGDLLKS